MTVDADIFGNVIEIEKSDGSKEFIAGEYRQPSPNGIYCSDCGEYLDGNISFEFNDMVAKHLAELEPLA
jgi:hypothetical protein